MTDDNDRVRDERQMLLRSTGLELSGDELDQVLALHERFTGDRARLASLQVGETEPAPIFHAARQDVEP